MKKVLIILFFNSISVFSQVPNKPNCLTVKETDVLKLKNNKMKNPGKNVFGNELELAGTSPLTGFYRDGFCATGINDSGLHVVAAVMTTEFLKFSKAQGNDLITPNPAYGFPGLKPGDVWCLCANRWKEAFANDVAPPVLLKATHLKALEIINFDDLKSKALP